MGFLGSLKRGGKKSSIRKKKSSIRKKKSSIRKKKSSSRKKNSRKSSSRKAGSSDWDFRKQITINLNVVKMPEHKELRRFIEVDGKPVNQMYLKSTIASVVSDSSPRTRGNLNSVNKNVHKLNNFKVKIRPTVTGFNEFFQILNEKMIEKKIDPMFLAPFPLGFLCFDNAGFGAEFGESTYWHKGAQKDMGKELMVCADPLYSPMSYIEYIHPEGDIKVNIWEEETWQDMLEAEESRRRYPGRDSPDISLTLYITTKLELFNRIYGLKYWTKSNADSKWEGYKSPEVAQKLGLRVSERLLGIHRQYKSKSESKSWNLSKNKNKSKSWNRTRSQGGTRRKKRVNRRK